MNTVQNGKGDTARNNWGQKWYSGYDKINWHHEAEQTSHTSADETDDSSLNCSRRDSESTH